jgi:hypothetical protein
VRIQTVALLASSNHLHNPRIKAGSFPTQTAKGCSYCICFAVENAGLEVSWRVRDSKQPHQKVGRVSPFRPQSLTTNPLGQFPNNSHTSEKGEYMTSMFLSEKLRRRTRWRSITRSSPAIVGLEQGGQAGGI